MADLKISQLSDGGASQATDEYVVARSGANYRIDGASVAAAATSVGTLTSLTVSGNINLASGQVLYMSGAGGNAYLQESGGTLFLGAGGAGRVQVTSSGNLGLGVTPSATTATKMLQLGYAGTGVQAFSQVASVYSQNAYNNSGWKYGGTGQAMMYVMDTGQHQWHTAASGTAGNAITWTQAMTLDASGKLGIGTVSPSDYLHVNGTGIIKAQIQGTTEAQLYLKAGYGQLTNDSGDLYLTIASATGSMIFRTGSSTERARITAGGYFKASNDGIYRNSTGAFHEMKTNGTGPSLIVGNTNASANSDIFAVTADRNTTNNTFSAIVYYNDGAGAHKFIVADSGNVTNTNGSYGTISDAKHKTDIVDAGSQWDDIKAVRFRKFKMKGDPSETMMLGVVAQELEVVSPGLVEERPDTEKVHVPVLDEDGNETGEFTTEMRPTGTTTKTVKSSILLMKAAVALQEAMARIEALEARLEALEA